jgi:regulator of sigma E protease
MNFLTAVLLAAALLAGPGLLAPDASATVGRVEAGTPAALAGLRSGDRVLQVAAQPVSAWVDLVPALRAHPGETIALSVERTGPSAPERLQLTLTLGKDGVAGFRQHELPLRSGGPGAALMDGLRRTADAAFGQVAMFGKAFSGAKGVGISGPLGIIRELITRLREGAGPFANVLWTLSIALAIFNLLPVPGLDGGRLVFLAYEVVTRRRVNARVENVVHVAGLVALMVLLVWVTLFGDLGLGQKLGHLFGR